MSSEREEKLACYGVSLYYRRAMANAAGEQAPQREPLTACVGLKKRVTMTTSDWERIAPSRSAAYVISVGVTATSERSRALGEPPRHIWGGMATAAATTSAEAANEGLNVSKAVTSAAAKTAYVGGEVFGFWQQSLTYANAKKTADVSMRTLKRVPTTLAKMVGLE